MLNVKLVIVPFEIDEPRQETHIADLKPDSLDHEFIEVETLQGRIHVYPDGAVLKFNDSDEGIYLQHGD